ncbi:DUF4919 domain-containing protein [Mucilaginibacter terrae]|uniref:DUF4919 domain-containing protein n=1 Tax=Mucilaginibacter terrae TaxID=1955052 RepID=UPI00362D092C
MTRSLFLALLICIFTISTRAQVVSGVNFDEIKASVSRPGNTNYQTLLKRAAITDSTLTPNDYKLLYFGQIFQTNYNPYGDAMALRDASKLVQEGKFNEAITAADVYLKDHPISLSAIYLKITALYQQKKTAEMKPWIILLKGLIAGITGSGDGKTEKTAMVVACVSDEYKVMSSLQVQMTKQTLTATQCDKMTLAQPNSTGLTELYFNVSKPLSKGFN